MQNKARGTMLNLWQTHLKLVSLLLKLIFFLYFSPDHLPGLQPLGCYKEKGRDRALPIEYANFRSQINWKQLETVQQCAQVAFNKGYEYFAVQF